MCLFGPFENCVSPTTNGRNIGNKQAGEEVRAEANKANNPCSSDVWKSEFSANLWQVRGV